MTVLVTGGAGFIGAHLCRNLLADGHKVVVLDGMNAQQLQTATELRMPDIKDKVTLVSGDICNFPFIFETLRAHDVQEIIHTAAITFVPTAIKNPSLTFKVNVEGSFNLLEAARILDLKRFLYISTSSVYGDFQTDLVNETHPLEPKDIYGATKLAADRLTLSYFKTYGLPASIVRTTSVYGPGDLENRAAKIFIENALLGKDITLEGGGAQKRSFSYVKDVARGINLMFASRLNGEVVHIAGNQDYTIRELADVIARHIPHTRFVDTPARQIDVNRGRLDISKAKKLLGYVPEFTLEKGITDYVRWMAQTYFPFFKMEMKNKPVVI